MFSYSLERAGGKFTVTPAGYILINDEIDRETEDVHSFQVSGIVTNGSGVQSFISVEHGFLLQ